MLLTVPLTKGLIEIFDNQEIFFSTILFFSDPSNRRFWPQNLYSSNRQKLSKVFPIDNNQDRKMREISFTGKTARFWRDFQILNTRSARVNTFVSFASTNLNVLSVKRAWNGFHFSHIFRSWVLSIILSLRVLTGHSNQSYFGDQKMCRNVLGYRETASRNVMCDMCFCLAIFAWSCQVNSPAAN